MSGTGLRFPLCVAADPEIGGASDGGEDNYDVFCICREVTKSFELFSITGWKGTVEEDELRSCTGGQLKPPHDEEM